MASAPPLYDISIWLEVDDPLAVAEALVEALGDVSPADARGVRATGDGVIVDFPDMKARASDQPAVEAIVEPADMQRILPVLQTLISLSAARVKAGLTPSDRIVIDIRPASGHPQDELRHA